MDKRPAKAIAVVTCMDCRVDAPAALGLALGEAHVLRNAGGLITDDMLRSLAISQRALGTTAVALVHHTDCGMDGFDDAAFRSELAVECSAEPTWDVPGFDDVRADVRRSVELVRACPWLPHREDVRGLLYDVSTGQVERID